MLLWLAKYQYLCFKVIFALTNLLLWLVKYRKILISQPAVNTKEVGHLKYSITSINVLFSQDHIVFFKNCRTSLLYSLCVYQWRIQKFWKAVWSQGRGGTITPKNIDWSNIVYFFGHKRGRGPVHLPVLIVDQQI